MFLFAGHCPNNRVITAHHKPSERLVGNPDYRSKLRDGPIMNIANLSTLLSIASTALAIVSSIVAFRTRRQIRLDLFDTQRDLLLLTMLENDARLKALEFKASLLRAQLSAAAARQTGTPNQPVQNLIAGLTELSTISNSLRRRDWTEEQVREAAYSEATLADVRRRTLDEQVTARTIQVDVHSLLLNEAETTLDQLRRTMLPSTSGG